METDVSLKYNDFLNKNRIMVNKYLNAVLWFFVITGPAIALGIKTGLFQDIKYSTCINISVGVVILASIHLFLLKSKPNSIKTSYFAITALDMLIVYMSYSHVSIYLTWFLVPMLSLMFCDKRMFFSATVINYVFMAAVTLITAPYYAELRIGFDSSMDYFVDVIGGFTIETIIMASGGYIIVKLTVSYYKQLLLQYNMILEKEEVVKEKMNILGSMAEIYDNVNLIDFINNTEMSIRDSEHKKQGIDMNTQTHTIMNQQLKNNVMPDQLEEFLTFTNIKTVRKRLSHKKLISADFIDMVSGWFRAQYITVDSTLDGIPNMVIYTTRNVDEEKRREENLVRISMTDEMTRLFNRRCYDEDLKELKTKKLSDDFVLFSIDVNGLKTVNDTKGHAAGDELIKGAANCIALSVGNKGKVYRTGGDEFMAIVHTDSPEDIRTDINNKAKEWHGMYTDEITMSVGFALYKNNSNLSVDDLEHLADEDMYNEKEKYYKERGIERRR